MALLQNDKAIFYHPLNDATESLKSQAWTLGAGSLAGAGKISNALSGVTGDTAAFGAETLFSTSGSVISVSDFSSTAFVVAYKEGGTGFGAAKVGTVSGSDITYGTAVDFLLKNPSA